MAWKGPTIGQALLLIFGGLATAFFGCAGALSLGDGVAPILAGAVMAGGLIASVVGIAMFVGVVIRFVAQKLGR
jgi:hypothetical protein